MCLNCHHIQYIYIVPHLYSISVNAGVVNDFVGSTSLHSVVSAFAPLIEDGQFSFRLPGLYSTVYEEHG